MADQLTQYEFDRDADRLGSGAFGEVYRAWDKVLKRKVALKISKPTAPGDDRYSIPNEVLKIMDYRHENLVNYFYAFETEGTDDIGKKIRRQVAVMEFVEGKDLHKIIRDSELNKDPEKITEISTGILKGLHFLHDHRIIHRDLKPSNIMILQKDGHYISKITDFGISKEFDANSYVSLSGVIGTFSYMAPEQFGNRNSEGRKEASLSRIDLRLDIWAFGVILYEMLLGFPPFGNERTHSTAEIIDNILQTIIPEEIMSVSEPWRSVIQKCLQRDPDQRYKNAEELMAAITGKEEELFWEKSIVMDSKESYEKYIAAYPGGKFIGEAKKRMEILVTKEKREIRKKEEESFWNACLDINTVSDFQDYLNRYPDGDHTEDAGMKIEVIQKKKAEEEKEKAEKDFWRNCVRTDTIAAYEKYLLNYKDGIFTKEAKERILALEENQHTVFLEEKDESEWRKIKDQDQKSPFENYIRKFPGGKYKDKALDSIAKITKEENFNLFTEGKYDQLSWDYLEKRITWEMGEQYLNDYPKGIHVAEIQQKIRKVKNRQKWYWAISIKRYLAISIITLLGILTIFFIRFIPREKSNPDKILYDSILDSKNPDDFVSFMRTYPKSVYSVPVSLKVYKICNTLMQQGTDLIWSSDKLSSVNFEKTQSLLSALVFYDKAQKLDMFSFSPSPVIINEDINKIIKALETIQADVTASINYSKQEYGKDWDATEYLKILTTIQKDSLFIKWNENRFIKKPKFAS